MSLFKPERLCLLCSYRSIELKQYGKVRKGTSNSKTFQATNHGLICSNCNAFVCIDCIRLLIPTMKKDRAKFCNDSLLKAFIHADNTKKFPIKSPSNFVGHCCIIDDTKSPASSDSLIDSVSSSDPSKLSGCIFFPDFNLFVDSPISCMDIHAVGAETSVRWKKSKKRLSDDSQKSSKETIEYLPARWHCVIPHTFALSHDHLAPRKNGTLPNSWSMTAFRNLKIKAPHNPAIIQKVCLLFDIFHLFLK